MPSSTRISDSAVAARRLAPAWPQNTTGAAGQHTAQRAVRSATAAVSLARPATLPAAAPDSVKRIDRIKRKMGRMLTMHAVKQAIPGALRTFVRDLVRSPVEYTRDAEAASYFSQRSSADSNWADSIYWDGRQRKSLDDATQLVRALSTKKAAVSTPREQREGLLQGLRPATQSSATTRPSGGSSPGACAHQAAAQAAAAAGHKRPRQPRRGSAARHKPSLSNIAEPPTEGAT
jgi:hypothetical protein